MSLDTATNGDSDSVYMIKKQFMAGISQKTFDWQLSDEDWSNCTQQWQKHLLYSTVWLPLAQKYPPSFASRKAFVKALISKLENVGADTCDELYDLYSGYVEDEVLPSGYSYKTYIMSEELVITLREGCCIVEQGTTGCVTWDHIKGESRPGSKRLAEWCVENREIFQGRTVVELGCGLGLAGLVVIKSCQPLKYLFTDCHPEVLRLLRYNLMLNVDSPAATKRSKQWSKSTHSASNFCWNDTKITMAKLDWEYFNSCDRVKADVVIAADVVYDPEIGRSLLKVLEHLLDSLTSFAVIACTVRNEETHRGFLTEAESRGFTVEKMEPAKRQLFFKSENAESEMLRLSRRPPETSR